MIMVQMSNDISSDGTVIRNGKENGSCSSNGASFVVSCKWKPRKVSCNRDFPRGCGPIVISVNVAPKDVEASTSLVSNNNEATQVESLTHEDAKVGLIVEPLKVNNELQNGEHQALLKEEVNGTVTAMVKVDDVKLLPKFRRRRVSAVRSFPPFCGLNAPEPTEEERRRITGRKNTVTNNNHGGSNPKLTESIVNGGEESNGSVKDELSHKTQLIESNNNSPPMENQETSVTRVQRNIGQTCHALVVYTRDNVLKNNSPLEEEDDEEKLLEENRETQENITTPNNDIKKKRPLDDTNDQREKRGLVLGLRAPSFSLQEILKSDLTKVEDTAKRNNSNSKSKPKPKPKSKSITPKKKSPPKRKKAVKDESTSIVEKDAYNGTLDLVIKDEDYVLNPEPISQAPQEVDVTLPPFGPKSSDDARNKVRKTLRLFQALCRKILQGEEAKTKQTDETKTPKRVDLEARNILIKKGQVLDRGQKTWGHIPGVEVGDEFTYRVELALVGIHWRLQDGIDYTKQNKDVVTTSIVASGGYDNEVGEPDCLTYSGSGGIVGKEKKVEDQKLERGNLALKNSIDYKLPVRVIRGYKSKPESSSSSSDSKSRGLITYIYDGLYTVENYYQATGPLGNMVYKFQLKRIPGQPELALREVKSKIFKTREREGLLVNDISNGKEVFKICAVNNIDNEQPPSFTYITKIVYPDSYHAIPPKGCDCVGRCTKKKCACALKNGGEIPYNHNGAIVEAKPLVYECGPSCKCPPSCYNRVTQHGMKIQLEIFKTESRGWGVRSLSSIPSGSFICEYIGELLEDTEAEKRTGNDEYLFDIGQNYSDFGSSVDVDVKMGCGEGGFTIDAAYYGNVGRFINHSCSPNLYAQNVLYDQEDQRMPHIMLFAAENISPLQELTYHYNYAVDTVHDSEGNIKVKSCYCGSPECTGRLY